MLYIKYTILYTQINSIYSKMLWSLIGRQKNYE